MQSKLAHSRELNGWQRWLVVWVYAVAMAWVESAVVFYLRTMIHRLEPHQANPFPAVGGIALIEMVREAATLVMLAAVGLLAGRDGRSRLGYAALAFGVWDIFYYVFLKAMCGWPNSILDWDILFLIPLPWWGPVLAPLLISIVLISWGTMASQFERNPGGLLPSLVSLGTCAAGLLLALYVFMADAIAAAPRGVLAIRNVVPGSFHWPLFCCALLLMATPTIQGFCQLWFRPVTASSKDRRE